MPFSGIYTFLSKTGKNFKDFMKKGREKGGKEEKIIKHTLKYLYEA